MTDPPIIPLLAAARVRLDRAIGKVTPGVPGESVRAIALRSIEGIQAAAALWADLADWVGLTPEKRVELLTRVFGRIRA